MSSATHKQLANRLGTSITAVAIIREIWAGTSAHSQRALREKEGNVVEAAKWLATFRRCWAVADEITPELVQQVGLAEGKDVQIYCPVPAIQA